MRIEPFFNLWRATVQDGGITLSVTAPSRCEAIDLLINILAIRHKEKKRDVQAAV
jgi:hypothetical protein